MATTPLDKVIFHLRRAVLLRDGAGLTDAQLLERFLLDHDKAAMEALVWRHGPMVWGVCHRVLRNQHDAEDAVQATFLVFVRKASSIMPRNKVANWLHAVAHQTALNARAKAARMKQREMQVFQMPEPAIVQQELWHDLEPLLDQELRRLPDKYRAVVVLCDLEGKTRKEAARQLGVPEGTVAGHLARARAMLAKRLAKYGPAVSATALATMLVQHTASACVPTGLLHATALAACIAAGGTVTAGLISADVVNLMHGVLMSRFSA